jgi:hypothetical protein
MQSAIITKLKRELAEPITTERQVVYVLVEIRKLLESTGLQAKYNYLWFHASWAVHPNMDRGVAANLLKYFDEAYPLLKDKEIYELPPDLHRAISDAIDLHHFKRQLREFLVEHALSTAIAERQWTTFLRLYASVIEDCPLVVSSGKLKNLTHVVVNVEDAPGKIPGLEHMEHQLCRVRWICHATDNTNGELFTMFTIP